MVRLSWTALLVPAITVLAITGLPIPAAADAACEDQCIQEFIWCDNGCAYDYDTPSCSQGCDDFWDQCMNDCSAADAGGRWLCTRHQWTAATTERKMLGLTFLECGFFNCGDTSHSQPSSWVDISGGISQTCEDRSDSFHGPDDGEWNMCSVNYYRTTYQVDTGRRFITGVNQNWDRWPYKWRQKYSELPQADICNTIGGSGAMVNPFASVYDLDYCINKQIAGTVYWPNFNLSAKLIAGDCNAADGLTANYADFRIEGSTGLACGIKESDCANVVCSDLEVTSGVSCTWHPH